MIIPDKNISRQLKSITNKIKPAIKRGGLEAGDFLKKSLQAKFSEKGRSGRTYLTKLGVGSKTTPRVLAKPRLYQASTPYEYSQIVTKRLFFNLDKEMRGFDKLEFGNTVEYAETTEKRNRNMYRIWLANPRAIERYVYYQLNSVISKK